MAMRACGCTYCAFGRHERKVDPVGERKSVSSETTFNDDILGPRQILEDISWRQSERTAARREAFWRPGTCRYAEAEETTHDFRSFTRPRSSSAPTQPAQVIFRVAKPMLARETTARGIACSASASRNWSTLKLTPWTSRTLNPSSAPRP